jgi:hypothetical protein
MTDDRTYEAFLARWSRRKRAAGEDQRTEQVGPSTGSAPSELKKSEHGEPEQKPDGDEPFDPASLPPLDSIKAETDVTAFLRKGVPPDLTRAALRRAWSSDPAIRDFVGLAENSWDFNDPTAIPGFGPLDQSPEQVRRMVADLFGEVRQVADQVVGQAGKLADDGLPAPSHQTDSTVFSASDVAAPDEVGMAAGQQTAEGISLGDDDHHSAAAREEGEPAIALQQNDALPAPRPRRSHGGALPR